MWEGVCAEEPLLIFTLFTPISHHELAVAWVDADWYAPMPEDDNKGGEAMAHDKLGRLFSIVVLTVLMAAFGGVSFAQDTATDEEGEVPPEWDVMVGEITVTAQKIEQDIQDVPLSVSTLSGEDLEIISAGSPDVRILSARVPSLILESSFGKVFPRFYIRGLGNSDFDLNASQPVSMVVDEVVLENPMVKAQPLFDLDRVEVLRGPQGSLFGRNTPAGVVKFETRKPTREFDAFARLSYGTYDTVDLSGAVGGPLGDYFSARASFLYQGRSDWVDNLYTEENDALGGYDNTAWRLQLMWEPSERFDALLNVHGWEIDGTARLFRANILEPGSGDLVDGFEWDEVYYDGLNQQEASSLGGLLRLEYQWEDVTLTSITGYESLDDMYSRGDIDGGFGQASLGEGNYGPGFIPFYSESADGIPYLDQWTQELRLHSTSGDTFNWLVGAFWFNEDVKIDSFSYASLDEGNPLEGYAFQTQDSTSYAFFGSLDFQLAPQWNMVVGARYSNDERDFSAERPFPVFQTPTEEPITEFVEDDNVSWNVSLTYAANPNVNIYGRVATGYRAPSIQGRILFCADFEGGTNPATNCVTTADSEEIISAELGLRSILAQNKLRLNLTGYYFELDGQQLTAVGGEYNIATLLNADTTEGYGFEADLEWTPSGHFLATMGLSYNPTKIKDENLTVAPCGGGCTVTDPVVDGLAYIDGNSLPHAPDWIFNGILTWRSSPTYKKFFASLDWAYYSEKQFFLYESEEYKDDSFELGLRLGYAFARGKHEVALFARNLLDEQIVRGGIDFNNLTGMVNEPRIIGAELVLHF